MNIVYNSEHYHVVEYPGRNGYELIDKTHGLVGYMEGEVADVFRASLERLITDARQRRAVRRPVGNRLAGNERKEISDGQPGAPIAQSRDDAGAVSRHIEGAGHSRFRQHAVALRSAEGTTEMDMGIDQSRQDHLPRGVDDPGQTIMGQIRGDRRSCNRGGGNGDDQLEAHFENPFNLK